jgi:hypothetical protein
MSQPASAQVSMDLYEYDPLPGPDYIRTATILPGKAGEDIKIDLATVPLRGNGTVYTALSYAWGSPDVHVYAQIQDNTSLDLENQPTRRCMGLSKNLGTALHDLRSEDRPRTMWIDAICIDQGNFEEKAVQVSKIGNIFQHATHVVAYLGPEADGSAALMEYLEHIGRNSTYDWDTCILDVAALRQQWNGMRLVDDDDNLLVDSRRQERLYKLWCRPWFERLWIRQEIKLSETKAMITCGRTQVPWPFFLSASTCLYVHFNRTNSLQPQYLRKLWQVSSVLESNQRLSLCTLRDSFRGMKCMDPRDRLYAVLELLPEDEKRLIDVSYKKSPADVYKQAALRGIETHRNLSILLECELQDGWLGPTWVPNWGAESQVDVEVFSGFKTSRLATIMNTSQAVDKGVLRVVGAKITTIEDLRPSGIDLESTDLSAKLHDLFSGIETEGGYVAGGTLQEAYAAAILRGKLSAAIEPENDRCSSLDDAANVVQMACSASLPKDIPLKEETLVNLRLFCANRQLLRGSSGYVGMAPPGARKGDHVYTILGCDYPLVLREIGEGKMQVVGGCYISGAIEHQALLGPLPADVEAVFVRANGNRLGVRNRVTKEMIDIDPRLSMLPLTDEEKECLRTWNGSCALEISLGTLRKHNSEVKWVDLL